jgi:hypothetical protein
MLNFFRLIRRNWRLAFAAWFAVALTRLGLWALPYRVLHRWSQAASRNKTQGDLPRRLRIAQAVRIVSRLVPAASCLTQALATQWLLRARGESARVCVGAIRGANGGFQAHAWLEHDGGILIGSLPDLERYQPFRRAAMTS